ncbi:GNAT family N-acetyltransferase [Mangrovibacterium diazotrophicum]|uniref:Putative N-acetyltransferase YhbS n=1 Tax=Mangrovibacterium diazotrophicum TaxID=1261403 RepID=A0A419VYC3_9BACT|nr:N-acetyltransferase [Mangrovibacterium diazotrophicum]RKD88174.1 putative N-acetyltransferase YhbS [Mangrovibacterium diazotrophicum]
MKVKVRQETEADYDAVFKLTEEAFRSLDISDHREQFLVQRLRHSDSFIPELSMVACLNDGTVVGHILLTAIKIVEDKGLVHHALTLAPVSVLPEYQNQNIGSQLIVAAQNKALEMGYKAIVLVGHEKYYPRFGYELCSKHNIKLPFDAPAVNCMVMEIIPFALNEIKGTVQYDPAFFE